MRKLMLFTIGFGAACALGAYLDYFSLFSAIILLFLSLGFAFLSLKWKSFRIPVFLLIGMSVGICWFSMYDHWILSDARSVDGRIQTETVEAVDYSYETDYGSAVDGVIDLNGKQYRVRVYLKDHVELNPGDQIHSSFRFRFTASGGAKIQLIIAAMVYFCFYIKRVQQNIFPQMR